MCEIINMFTSKYHFILEDTWQKSKKDSELRKNLEEYQYRKLNSGEVEWNSFIEEVLETAGQHEYLLKLVSFHFENKTYSGLGNFNGYHFAFSTYFKDCTFNEEVTFYKTKIDGLLSFMDVTFDNKVIFGATNITSNLEFINCEFKDDFLINRCNISKDVVFSSKCKFYGDASFITSSFSKSLLLGNTRFTKSLPDLRESSFIKSVDLVSIDYKESKIYKELKKKKPINEKKLDIEGDISIFNKLKTIADSNGDNKNARNFFALSLKAASLIEPWYLSWVTKLYGISSDFARSFSRPLFSLLIIVVIGFSINHFNINFEQSTCGTTYKNEWIMTIQRSIPFGLGFEESTLNCAKEIYGTSKSPPVLIQVLNMTQVILSYVLWFLFVLAIRNRFKI